MNDEFYIGWEDNAPPGIGSRVRRAVLLLLACIVALGVMLPLAQRTIGVSVFEWGKVKSFTGVLRSQPYPHLLVPRPGASASQTPFSSYYLVKPFKFGLDSEIVGRLEGKTVNLKGTLIYRGNQTMIEVTDNSIKALDDSEKSVAAAPMTRPVSLGQQTPSRLPRRKTREQISPEPRRRAG